MELPQDQLRAFFEVSKLGSFTKAAAELGLTQSALSHRINKLEGYLEQTLLVRDPQGVRPTEAGQRLLEYCRLQSQIETELLADFKGPAEKTVRGFLRIGGASTVLWSAILPALAKFLQKNPAIRLELMERELRDLPALLASGRADMIVTCGKVENDRFEGVHLGDEVNVLVEGKSTPPKSAFLDHDPGDQTTFNFLRLQKEKRAKVERHFMDNIHGIIAGVEAGLGRAVLPRHLLKHRPGLRAVEDQREMSVPVYLYFLKQPYYSNLHQQTVAELEVRARSFLS